MDCRSQSGVVSLFSYVTSSNLQYYGIVKTDINTGCYFRMWPWLCLYGGWWEKKNNKSV